MTAPTTHARLSASGAHKWMNCSGSLLAEAPYPETSSKYADEGSVAHLLASICLQDGLDPDTQVGARYSAWPTWRVTQDMADAVRLYVDFVRSLWIFCDTTWVERKAMVPEAYGVAAEDIGGTSDAGGIDFGSATLHVTDLKFGRGVVVEVAGNEQFRIYALAAYGALDREDQMRVKHVTMHVVQPRADHPDGPIRTETIAITTLLLWAQEVLRNRAAAALKPNAPRAVGDWCTFCKAKGACMTFRTEAFEAIPFDLGTVPAVTTAVAVAEQSTALTPTRIGEIYRALDRLEEWAAAFRSFTWHCVVEEGIAVPGVGVKRKRTNRNWLDEGMVAEALGGVKNIYVEPKLLSPAQLEKWCKATETPFPEHLVVKDEGDLTLCAADDPHAVSLPSPTASRFTTLETP